MKKQRGQITIFFSTAVIVMITMMGFIINIGIFVKAKINLQNATDAAAFAGAAVQARQLSNIGHVNWTMRNVFKEWMFKYYVLGGLNLEGVIGRPVGGDVNCPPKTGGDRMDFTMSCYSRSGAANNGADQYNFPSVCIDFANTGSVGLCTRFVVPGLPRFSRQNVLGMDETTNAFIDSIVAEKSDDCSRRTQLNFLTAQTWAYNVTETSEPLNNISATAPEVAVNFMGAFPKAFEIGLRIRNLESEVNFPPQAGICGDVSSGVDCRTSANDLPLSHHERTLKAYLSGMKNLGSGNDREMKDSFTLTEIPPKPFDASADASLSNLLMPPGAVPAKQKYYLDLKLITANYAPFYTAFATSKGTLNVDGETIDSEAQCAVTKIGLPVPGYPLHFVKNPEVMTYYAVEGKARFIGLFNPFVGDMTLKAYAAAKPFGGRVGPQVFDVSDVRIIKSRSNRKSSPFISALDTATFVDIKGNVVGNTYEPGLPIPMNIGSGAEKFWMTGPEDSIGGFIADGNEVYFGVPNLIYDYPSGNIADNQSYLSERDVQVLAAGTSAGTIAKAGLYNKPMFDKMKAKLNGLGTAVTTTDINNALKLIQAPTLYEAHNFLIPTPQDLNLELRTDSYGNFNGAPSEQLSDNQSRSYDIYDATLYAPLYDQGNPNFLFNGNGELQDVLNEYLERMEPAILKYKSSMNLVASNIFQNNRSGATDQNTAKSAARILSDLTDGELNSSGATVTEAKPGCSSMAGQFLFFYSGNPDLVKSTDGCPTPLAELMASRWNNQDLTGQYTFKYALPQDNAFRRRLFSAYHPGDFHNANNGTQNNPLSSTSPLMIRNFYSTKFIPLKSVASGADAMFSKLDFLMYSEGHPKQGPNEIKQSGFNNPLDATGIDISGIEH